MNTDVFDAIIVGAGPAGLTAGIYLARSRRRTLILNIGTVGGQLILTHEIANYPGIENITGYQLATNMKKQALHFGATIQSIREIEELDLKNQVKRIKVNGNREFFGKTIIFTPGGRPRPLGVDGEDRLKGLGISYCATCDGEFFTDKEIAVIGGGNSALEESVSLSRYASKVTIIHQFDHFQAFNSYVEEARQNPKIEFLMESVVSRFLGEERLQGIVIKNVKTGIEREIKLDGVFVFIGYQPNTEFLKNVLTLNDRSEVVVNADMETNISGVFAAGDSIAKKYRQVTTAVGEATIAALASSAYLHQMEQKEILVP